MLILIILLISFSAHAGPNSFLVLNPQGEQRYLEDVESYYDNSRILFRGKISKAHQKAIGALVVIEGVVSIDPVKHVLIIMERNQKATARLEKETRQNNFSDVDQVKYKKVLKMMVREYLKRNDIDPQGL